MKSPLFVDHHASISSRHVPIPLPTSVIANEKDILSNDPLAKIP